MIPEAAGIICVILPWLPASCGGQLAKQRKGTRDRTLEQTSESYHLATYQPCECEVEGMHTSERAQVPWHW